MATAIFDGRVDIERAGRIQALVDAGEMAAMTTITKRPSDQMCFMGTWYGGQWYPPTDPRGAELEKMRYMLPAGEAKASPLSYRCKVCGEGAVYLVHLPFFEPAVGSCCIDAAEHWRSVLDLVRPLGYDPTCGMQPDKAWALDFMLDVAQDWMEAEVAELIEPNLRLRFIGDKGVLSLTTAAHVYLSAIGVGRASSKSGVFAPGHMYHFAMEVHAAFARWHYPVKFTAPEVSRECDPESVAHVTEMFSKCLGEEIEADLLPIGWPSSIHEFIDLGWQFVKNSGGRPYIVKAYDDRDLRPLSYYRYSQVLANRGWDLLPAKNPEYEYPHRPDITPNPDCFLVFQLNALGATLHCANTPMTSWTHCIPTDLLTDDDGVVHYEDEPEETIETVLPQVLQSNEDVLELIAMSKAPVPPAMIDQLVEAVKYAVEHWNVKAARVLPNRYYLTCRPEGAPVPTWIYLKHPDHPNCIVVGELSIMSDKATHSELEFVSKRGEIRAMMIKVSEGPRQFEHPALQSWNTPDRGGAA